VAVDLTLAKQHSRIESGHEDALLEHYLAAAVAAVEKASGKFLSVKPFSQRLAGFPRRSPFTVRLFFGPVRTVDEIAFDPAGGGAEEMLGDFRLVEGPQPALLPAYGATWPDVLPGPGTVRISGTAGFADGEAPELDQAVLALFEHFNFNRSAVVTGTIATELPIGVKALIAPHRPVGIG